MIQNAQGSVDQFGVRIPSRCCNARSRFVYRGPCWEDATSSQSFYFVFRPKCNELRKMAIELKSASPNLEEWILKEIGYVSPGCKILTDTQIALKRNVSTRTVRRVMSKLAMKGLVVRKQGMGSFVPHASHEANTDVRKKKSSEHLQEELEKQIRDGVWRPKTQVPSVRSISEKFHVSPHSVAQALLNMEKKKLLYRNGKRRVVGLDQKSASKEVFVFTGNPISFSTIWSKDWLSAAFKSFEEELARCKFSICYLDVDKWPTIYEGCLKGAHQPHAIVFLRCQRQRAKQFVRDLDVLCSLPRTTSFSGLLLGATGNTFAPTIHQVASGSLNTTRGRVLGEWAKTNGLDSIRIWVNAQKKADIALRDIEKIRNEILMKNPDADLSVSEPDWLTKPNFRKWSENQLWIFVRDQDALQANSWLKTQGKTSISPKIITLENSPLSIQHNLSGCAVDLHHLGYCMAHAIMGDIPVERTSRGFLRIRAKIVNRRDPNIY